MSGASRTGGLTWVGAVQHQRELLSIGSGAVRENQFDGFQELNAVRTAHDDGTEQAFALLRVERRNVRSVLAYLKVDLLLNTFGNRADGYGYRYACGDGLECSQMIFSKRGFVPVSGQLSLPP